MSVFTPYGRGKGLKLRPFPQPGNTLFIGRLLNIRHAEIDNCYVKSESAFSGRHAFGWERKQDFHAASRRFMKVQREYHSFAGGS